MFKPTFPLLKKVEQNISLIKNQLKSNKLNFSPLFLKVEKVDYIIYNY